MSEQTQVLIIGGGPAGMTAAITAASRGREVVLLEGNERVGKKILATGNGKCNFTNRSIDPSCYHGDHKEFTAEVLAACTGEDLIDWFYGIGVESTVKSGRVYPRSEQASSVLDALRLQLARQSVRVETGAKVMSIRRRNGQFEVQTVQAVYTADSVVLAAGSAAAPRTGSDGSGYRLAEQAGLTVVEPLPALAGLRLEVPYTKSWAGVRCDGAIGLYTDGMLRASSEGQLQLTAYGVSGIPAFQVCRFASRALAEGGRAEVSLNFFADRSAGETVRRLTERAQMIGDYPASQFLNGVLPKNLAGVLLRMAGCPKGVRCSDLSREVILRLASVMTDLRAPVSGTGGFAQAQVCTGGIGVDQIDARTMGCRQIRGLYVAGEIMDVDGLCGGYNLHWAFATGRIAGMHA